MPKTNTAQVTPEPTPRKKGRESYLTAFVKPEVHADVELLAERNGISNSRVVSLAIEALLKANTISERDRAAFRRRRKAEGLRQLKTLVVPGENPKPRE